jgi:hypothetical protein
MQVSMYVSIALVFILLIRMGLAFNSKKCCFEVCTCVYMSRKEAWSQQQVVMASVHIRIARNCYVCKYTNTHIHTLRA